VTYAHTGQSGVEVVEVDVRRDRPARTSVAADDDALRSSHAGAGRARPSASTEASLSDHAWIRSQRVTVLMATFNRAHFIKEALDSLLEQTRPPDELIVIDDGSTDDTRARVERYGSRVQYLHKANGGKSTAINFGLASATGDWIWCFDDDDAALPRGLEELLNGLARHRDADFAYGGQVTGESGPDGRILPGRTILPPDVSPRMLFAHSLRNIPFLLQGTLVKRDRFLSLHGFNERYARSQDYEFITRLLADARGVRVAAPIFIWRSHDGPRGPHHEHHEGALRERVWMEVGGRLGKDLRRRLSLQAYLPSGAGKAGMAKRDLRRALLERMAIMASKGLIQELLVDLHSAANVEAADGVAGLARGEARAAWEVGNFPFFQMRLLDEPERVGTRLLAAARSRVGKLILARIARGILHAARHPARPAGERRVLARCALRLFAACGPVASARAYLPARIDT